MYPQLCESNLFIGVVAFYPYFQIHVLYKTDVMRPLNLNKLHRAYRHAYID